MGSPSSNAPPLPRGTIPRTAIDTLVEIAIDGSIVSDEVSMGGPSGSRGRGVGSRTSEKGSRHDSSIPLVEDLDRDSDGKEKSRSIRSCQGGNGVQRS